MIPFIDGWYGHMTISDALAIVSAWNVSDRKACRMLGVGPKTISRWRSGQVKSITGSTAVLLALMRDRRELVLLRREEA